MLASIIVCQACGCEGRAGNTLSQNHSESFVFHYHGHDLFDGSMRFSCANCNTRLLVDPMDMLTTCCQVKGIPEMIKEGMKKNQKSRIILQAGKILQKIQKTVPALK
jgi:hypothetical protein